MKRSLVLLSMVYLIFSACTKDAGKIDITYTKATAIYGDLAAVRATPILETPRTLEDPGKIFVSDDLLLIGEEEKGIHIFDNSNPDAPQATAFLNVPLNKEFFVKDDIIYAESQFDFLKIDISDLNNPTIVSRVENAFGETIENAQGEQLIGFDFETVTESFEVGSDLYNNIWNNQEEIFYFDYSNSLIPTSAVPASFSGNSSQAIGTVNRIAAKDEHVFVVSRANIYIFEDNGELSKNTNNFSIGWNMETVFPFEDRLFIGTQNSMDVYDISTPNNPQYESSFWHATSCDPVLPTGDVAYVTLRTGDFSNCPGDENALVVVDVRQFQNAVAIQEIEMESPYGMTKIGNLLYVGEGANGLKIFEIANDGQLSEVSWDKSIQAYDVIPHPTRSDRLLIAGPQGLGQYEIQGNSNMNEISFIQF